MIIVIHNYSKTSESLWQYYRDEQALNDAGALNNFPGNDASLNLTKKQQAQPEMMVQKMLK